MVQGRDIENLGATDIFLHRGPQVQQSQGTCCEAILQGPSEDIHVIL